MDFILILAWFLLGVAVLEILGGPFSIGKPREPYSASGYMVNLIIFTLLILLAGRVIGWW